MVTNQVPGGHSEREPPDPISNSEVKTLCADASVGSPHVKVGHCQDFIHKPLSSPELRGFFIVTFSLVYENDYFPANRLPRIGTDSI